MGGWGRAKRRPRWLGTEALPQPPVAGVFLFGSQGVALGFDLVAKTLLRNAHPRSSASGKPVPKQSLGTR